MAVSKKTYVWIGAGIAVAVVLYFLFFRKSGGGSVLSDTAGAPSADNRNFSLDPDAKKLMDFFKAKADPAALSWLIKTAYRYYDNPSQVNSDYHIGGKVTKASAFMAAYGSDYALKANYKFNGVTADQFHGEIWGIFAAMRDAQTVL